MRAPAPGEVPDGWRRRERAVFLACSLALFFGQGVVFAGLGVTLHAMAQDMGWSAAETGGAFTAMIVAACVGATLPVWLIARVGGRWTMTAGALVMALGFFTASFARALPALYLGTALSGAGFSLLANTPAFTMIAGWSGERVGGRFGLYLMTGAIGTAAGPVAASLLTRDLGWAGYWRAMGIAALALAVLLAWLLREPPVAAGASPRHGSALRPLRTFSYGVLAAAMVLTQAAIMTMFSAAPSHLVGARWSGGGVAAMLGAQGLVGAIGTGVAGFLLRHVSPRAILVAALCAQVAGIAALALGDPWIVYALFVPAFGLGSALVTLSVTVLLVDTFGRVAGTAGLALIWSLAGAASAGPWLAGLVADRTGSFAPALWSLAAILLPVAAGAMTLPGSRQGKTAPPA